MKAQMNQLFEKIHKVPQIPEVVKMLLDQLNNPNITFDAIAKNVEREQIISMKVLRLVNSAHFGLPRKISSIDEAIGMLGISKLKTLIIASGIVGSVPDIPNFDIKQFWAESFRTATYAKWLAEDTKLNDSDMIFTAGLISDLGTILIYLGNAKAAAKIGQLTKAGGNQADHEQKVLGFTSKDVCAELCQRWHFSEELINTIAQSGKPLSFDEPSTPACVVNIAKMISESINSEISEEEKLESFPLKEWLHLGLSNEDIEVKLPQIVATESGLDGLVD